MGEALLLLLHGEFLADDVATVVVSVDGGYRPRTATALDHAEATLASGASRSYPVGIGVAPAGAASRTGWLMRSTARVPPF